MTQGNPAPQGRGGIGCGVWLLMICGAFGLLWFSAVVSAGREPAPSRVTVPPPTFRAGDLVALTAPDRTKMVGVARTQAAHAENLKYQAADDMLGITNQIASRDIRLVPAFTPALVLDRTGSTLFETVIYEVRIQGDGLHAGASGWVSAEFVTPR